MCLRCCCSWQWLTLSVPLWTVVVTALPVVLYNNPAYAGELEKFLSEALDSQNRRAA